MLRMFVHKKRHPTGWRFKYWIRSVYMESALYFVQGSSSADHKNTNKDRGCKDERHKGKIPVILQIVHKENNGNHADDLHGKQPHDVAVPAAPVDQYEQDQRNIHDQDTGGQHKINGPATISKDKVNGNR